MAYKINSKIKIILLFIVIFGDYFIYLVYER